MSRKSLVPDNIAPFASAPAVGTEGDAYYNTAEDILYISNGTVWVAWRKIHVGTTAPSSPAVNDIWIDTA